MARALFSMLASLMLFNIATHVMAQDAATDKFFTEFTDEWVRQNPNQATTFRYFSGAEQDALERQMTPWTLEWNKARVQLARDGLRRLQALDRGRMSVE